MLSVASKPIMLSVNMLGVNMLSVNMLSVNMLSVNMLSINMLSVNMLSINMLSVNMLSVIRRNVVASCNVAVFYSKSNTNLALSLLGSTLGQAFSRTLKYWTRMEVTDIDKRTSLLQ